MTFKPFRFALDRLLGGRRRQRQPSWVTAPLDEEWIVFQAQEAERARWHRDMDLQVGYALRGFAEAWHLGPEELLDLGTAARRVVCREISRRGR